MENEQTNKDRHEVIKRTERHEHLNGIVNFLDDTLDSVEGYGCMVLEEVEEAYNPSSDAEHDPDYDY